MYEGQSSKLILFLLLILTNFIVRIPSIPHEKGYDSFFIHSVANSVTNFGIAKWWINWMSVFGLYPYSYASAVPFSLSGLSQLTGISMEYTILIFCIMLGFFSIFSAYMLATIFFDKFIYRFIFSVVFSLSASTVELTTWNITTRAQFLVFLPLFLYMLFKAIYGSKKHLFSYLVVALFLLATHHYVYLALFYSAIVIFTYAIFWLISLKPIFTEKARNINFYYFMVFVSCIIIMFLFGSKIGFITAGSRYQWIIDIVLISIRNAGFIFPIFIGAFIYLIFKKNKDINEWFLLISFIPTFFLSFNQTYGYIVTYLFITIIGTFGFSNIIKIYPTNKKYIRQFLILVLILNVAFSSFFTHYKTGIVGGYYDWYMGEETYVTGNWIQEYISPDEYAIGNGFETTRLFASYGGLPAMYSDDVNNYINGFLVPNESNYRKNSVTSTDFYFDNPYVLKSGTTSSGLLNWMLQFPITNKNAITFVEGLNVSYFFDDNYRSEPLFQSLPANKPLIYDSGRLSIFVY
ncbi:hypothetical protein MettiDRAFT_2589 [Methanolobus tindarius DSM 2278]|uniref:Membrane protein, required for N-linked glycosylation n=1 Tax=Methanolobus tindarius DSM 2278 TaxID=1090322 RepID=W9E0G1_METTI|nr:hypothetical protein MettiDRAFT_2589 [Methanolobus tindarius DSM 2278]